MGGITYLKTPGAGATCKVVATVSDPGDYANLYTAKLVRECDGHATTVDHLPGSHTRIVWPEVPLCADGGGDFAVTWNVITTTPSVPYQISIEVFDAADHPLTPYPGSLNPLEVQGATGPQSGDYGLATVLVL